MLIFRALLILSVMMLVTVARAQEWLEGEFATSSEICTDPESLVQGGVAFSLDGGFHADESDCEFVSVATSKQREAVVLTGLCLYAGTNRAELFVVSGSQSSDEILITPMIPATDWGTGMLGEETTFVRC